MIENGADTNLQNRDGRVPYEFAEESKRSLDIGVSAVKKAGLNMQKVESQRDLLDAIMRILVNKNPSSD